MRFCWTKTCSTSQRFQPCEVKKKAGGRADDRRRRSVPPGKILDMPLRCHFLHFEITVLPRPKVHAKMPKAVKMAEKPQKSDKESRQKAYLNKEKRQRIVPRQRLFSRPRRILSENGRPEFPENVRFLAETGGFESLASEHPAASRVSYLFLLFII